MLYLILENADYLVPITRYITEALMLYILFKYAYKSRRSEIVLDEKTKDQLIKDFSPEDIVDEKFPIENIHKIPSFFNHELDNSSKKIIIKYECSDYDIFNLRFENKKEIIDVIKTYGIGTCGPPGFYGTLDIHLELESKIAEVLEVESAILYSNSFTCINSVITCFCKHYDVLFYNAYSNEAILRGVGITKGSTISWNNIEDLEMKIKRFYDKSKRNFIITEGLFKNTGHIIDLPKIISLKNKYKLRLIVDESLSIPMLGRKGISEYYNTPINEIDVIIGSLAHVYCGSGGFAAGTCFTTDHQRLSAQSYCFSASMPGYLAKNAICNLNRILEIEDCLDLTKFFFENFKSDKYLITSDENSPMIVIACKLGLRIESSYGEEEKEEMVKIRKIKRNLEKECLRVGVIENPVPSLRICIKNDFSVNDIKEIARLLSKYCE